jgi:RNA polymerase sigma factor (sigma-70 family)
VGSSDEALLAGLAAGDRDAAATFVRRFQGRVYGLALSIVGDPATAEDVAQEAFMRAWRRADGYDARRGRVVTWLLAITRNVAIDVIRPKRAQPTDPDVLASRLQLDVGDTSGADAGLGDRELLR